jgi:glutamate N-acetyltransferase/amino-acid N-acetyltransferase
MAGHPSAGSPIDAHDARAAELEHAVTEVMRDLAGQILRDGEGATRVLELHVTGARTEGDARRIADSIVRSSLVKTALAGADPNWGRILAAAANAGVPLEQPSVSLALGGVTVLRDGAPVVNDADHLKRVMEAKHVRADLALGLGSGGARRFTTDLTAEYVRINADYTT